MSPLGKRVSTWAAAIAAIALVTLAGRALDLNPTTIGFVYLIVVLFVSIWGDLLVGTVSSIVATVCYNFFFFPPLYTLSLADPANWFALAAFLISSVTVNRLVVTARTLAQKAEQRRNEIETLYACANKPFAGAPYPPVGADVAMSLTYVATRPQHEPPNPKRPKCEPGAPDCKTKKRHH